MRLWGRIGSGEVKVTRGLGLAGYGIPKAAPVVVAWKEITEALRDRRTIINTIVLPVVLIPLAMAIPILMVSPKTTPPVVELVLLDDGGAAGRLASAISDQGGMSLVVRTGRVNTSAEILGGRADLVVVIPEGFTANLTSGLTASVDYYYDPFSMKSSTAISMVSAAVSRVEEEIVSERLRPLNLSLDYVHPLVEREFQVTSTGREVSPEVVVGSMMLPMMVGVIAITGAGTFALDMIAGERERKTIEALLTAPVGRLSILAGKYLAMTFFSLLAGLSTIMASILGLILMAEEFSAGLQVTGGVGPSGIGQAAAAAAAARLIPEGVNPALVLAGVVVAMILAGLTGNAVIVMTSSFAKTFKEAQQYLGATMGVLVLPMVAVPYLPPPMMGPLRLAPVTSIAMLVRDLLVDPGNVAALVESFASSVIYLMLLLIVSAKLFGRESVIFG